MNQDSITIILLAVFLICAIVVLLIGGWMYKKGPSSKRKERITRFVEPKVDDGQAAPAQESMPLSNQIIGKIRNWINNSLHVFSSYKLQLKLSSAYWTITDTEFTLFRIVAAIFAFFIGWLIPGKILGGILLAVIVVIVPPIMLDQAISQRQKKFHDQLLDVLEMVTGAVKSGYSLIQALDLAVKEIPAPASEEFGRVLREMRLGISLEVALFNLAERMTSDDMQIIVTAIIINSQVGGSLSTILDSTISTIRDRMHLFAEIRSLTSYGRYVGNFLSLMPFILGFILFIISPDYFDTFQTSIITRAVLLFALLSIFIGNIWIRKIVKINV